MTARQSEIDPAFAATLDRFDVPSATASFGDGIVAAALSARRPAPRSSRRPRPWTRRALAGGMAVALFTTAVAATLLDNIGIRVPTIPAALVTATAPAARPNIVKPAAPGPRAAKPPIPAIIEIDQRADAEIEVPATAPVSRREFIRERLRSLPPAERRAVVRRALNERARSRAVLGSERPLALRLANRPALREALIKRRRAMLAKSELAPVSAIDMTGPGRLDTTLPDRPVGPLAPLPRPDASVAPAKPVIGSPTPLPDRAERIRQQRQLNTRGRLIRRHRRP